MSLELTQQIRRVIESIATDTIRKQTKDCFRVYKGVVVNPPYYSDQRGDVCDVRLVADSTVLTLPYSSKAAYMKKGQSVWVATIFNSFRNAIVWETQDFEQSTLDDASWYAVQRSVRFGTATRDYQIGQQLSLETVDADSCTITSSNASVSASLDALSFVSYLDGSIAGIYVFTYGGTDWVNGDGDAVVLSVAGITLSGGTPAVGDTLTVTMVSTTEAYDVLGINQETPQNANLSNCLVCGASEIPYYGTIPYSGTQLLYYTDVELPAGNYRFTLNHGAYDGSTGQDATYMFTTTIPIPAGGGIRHNSVGVIQSPSYNTSQITDGRVSIYRADKNAIASGIAVTIWDGTTQSTDLGVFTSFERQYFTDDGKHNFTQRCAYGTNRWRDSAIRQWLNSDAPPASPGQSNWWTPATVFDTWPVNSNVAGFLYGKDRSFVNSIGAVMLKNALPTCDIVDDTLYDVTYDKVFLLSYTEINGTANNGLQEGTQFSYWQENNTATDRIKTNGGSARTWRMRSANPTAASSARVIYTNGSYTSTQGVGANGIVPVFCII